MCAHQWHRKLALTVPRRTDLFVVTCCAQCFSDGTSTVIQLLAVVYEQDRRHQAVGDVVFGAMWFVRVSCKIAHGFAVIVEGIRSSL